MQTYFIGSGFEPSKPLNGGCVGQVVASKAAGFAEGEVVSGMLPWSSHQILDADAQVGLALCCFVCSMRQCFRLRL
jgi:NADPH-dependent curcumin reductase CurA